MRPSEQKALELLRIIVDEYDRHTVIDQQSSDDRTKAIESIMPDDLRLFMPTLCKKNFVVWTFQGVCDVTSKGRIALLDATEEPASNHPETEYATVKEARQMGLTGRHPSNDNIAKEHRRKNPNGRGDRYRKADILRMIAEKGTQKGG